MKTNRALTASRPGLVKFLSLALALLLMVAALPLPAHAAFGWEESEGYTTKFDDAITVESMGTWMPFSGSQILVIRNNGAGDYITLEVSGDAEVTGGYIELQDGTTYAAEYFVTEDGRIGARVPVYRIPVGEPFRAELFFVVTRGNSGANLRLLEYANDGEIGIASDMTYPPEYTLLSPNEPSGIDYFARVPTPNNTPSSWAYDFVHAAIHENLVPENLQAMYPQSTTRAEFCALAVALYETVVGKEIAGRTTFSDTNDVNVEKMASLGVVQGIGGGKFAPNDSLSREQAATMLARLADVAGRPIDARPSTFADNAKISSWALPAVGQMQHMRIMGGVGDNTFAPNAPYTREQSITTMFRLYNYLTEK